MTENPLGYEKIPKLLKNFAVPSIVASLVGSIYNIVRRRLNSVIKIFTAVHFTSDLLKVNGSSILHSHEFAPAALSVCPACFHLLL